MYTIYTCIHIYTHTCTHTYMYCVITELSEGMKRNYGEICSTWLSVGAVGATSSPLKQISAYKNVMGLGSGGACL